MLELSHRSETDLTMSAAGDTFNTAVHLARSLGDEGLVSYFTALGDGWYADFVRSRMTAAGVVPVLVPMEGTPGAYLVRTDDDGERSFTYYRSSAAARQMLGGDGAQILSAICTTAALVHLSAISLQILQPGDREVLAAILDQARAGGARVSFDTNYRPAGWASARQACTAIDAFAARADIILPSMDDERDLRSATDATEVACYYRERGAREVVVTDGTAPTYLSWPDGSEWLSVQRPMAATDTTGAGDAFDAGYLAARLQQSDPVGAVCAAQTVAAAVVTHPGALPVHADSLSRPASKGVLRA